MLLKSKLIVRNIPVKLTSHYEGSRVAKMIEWKTKKIGGGGKFQKQGQSEFSSLEPEYPVSGGEWETFHGEVHTVDAIIYALLYKLSVVLRNVGRFQIMDFSRKIVKN